MILYFSGTGNSKYVAKRIADALGDALVNLNDRIKASDTSPVETGERLIIVTPTYAWRIPRVVRDWLLKTELRGAKQVWFVMTCGSEIGNADQYNRELCAEKGLACMGTAQIVMPENYIAMFSAPQADEARQIVAKAEPSIDRAIAAIQSNQPFAPTRNNLYDRFMSGPVNPIFYKCFVKADAFTVVKRLHRLWAVRETLSDEQRHNQRRQAGLGQELHPLHGVHLLLSGQRDRVRQKERWTAEVSL